MRPVAYALTVGLVAVVTFSAMAAPVISSISPSSGPISGGTVVAISGSDFTPDTTVAFNRSAASGVQVLDSSHIQLTVPPLGSGPFATALAAVRLTNVHGTTYGEYFYASPSFDEIGIGDITTIAGVGHFVGEGRPAAQALVEAEAIALDAAGNVYLGEETGGLVRKIGPDGRIITIAGTGIIGYSGDGGPAIDAQFNWPAGVALDRGGNIYVADMWDNSRVRRIDAATRVVTTIAGTGTRGFSGDGGLATQAQLNGPVAIAVDAQSNVYVMDGRNHRIRRIDASGVITTVAGNGTLGYSGDGGSATQASFGFDDQELSALAIDSRGTLYVADKANSRIRRIDTGGIVTTVVGAGTRPPANGAVATAVADVFTCVAVDGQDRLLFSTPTSIWRVERDGTLTLIGGTTTMGLSPDGAVAAGSQMAPENLAVAPNGDILVSERIARRIRRISASTGKLGTLAGIGPGWIGGDGSPATQAVFGDVGNIAIDADGNILVVDGRGSLRIRKIDSSGAMTTVAGTGVAPVQGFYHEGIAGSSAGMSPVSVGSDPANTLYFTDFCSVRHIGADGAVHTVVGPLTNVQQCGFAGDGGPGTNALVAAEQDVLKLDPQGRVFFADVFNQRVRRYDPASGIVTTFAGSGPASDPGGYFTGTAGFAGDGGPANQALLNGPTDMAFDPRGNVCISDAGNGAVRCVDPQGIIRTVAGGGTSYPGDGVPATSASIDPYRIAFDRSGNMYIATAGDGTIRKLDPNGILTTIAGQHANRGFSGDGGPATRAQIDYGSGLAVDAQGNILVYDGGNRRIRVIKEAATLGNPPSAELPGALSGLWWNPGESGWGIDLTQRGNTIFAAWYTYDSSGNPKWYVASDCAMSNATSCSGTLYQVTGPRFLGVPFNPAADTVAAVGSMGLSFTGSDAGSFTYSVGGVSRSVAIQRQLFASGPPPGTDYTDLWWNPSESGWGLAVTQQASVMFLALYVYDDQGLPTWYVASDCVVNGAANGCSGTLYRTTGPAFGTTFDSSALHVTSVGSASLSFTDPNNGTLTFTVDGISGSKSVTRQLF